MRLSISYSWDIPKLGLTDFTNQEFRFGEAESVDPDDDQEAVFVEPAWMKTDCE